LEVDRPYTPGLIKAEQPGVMRLKSLHLGTLPHGRLPMNQPRRATEIPLCANDLDAVPPAEILRAIQRDARIELDDDEIAYVLQDARSQCMGAHMTAARLLRLGRGLPSYEARPRPK
jgi:hypothetical protein